MPDPQDIHFMRLAVEQAVKGRETPGCAEVGAVLVRQGRVICTGFNEGEMRHDPTAHGEMVVIRRACEQLKRPAWKEPLCTARCSRAVCVRWRACGRASAESSLVRAAGTYMRCISNRGITTLWTSSGTPSAVTWRSKEVYLPKNAPNSTPSRMSRSNRTRHTSEPPRRSK
jgi:pyrimidine deaminase RibD-like protein